MSETREVKTWRKVFHVSRWLSEDSAVLDMLKRSAFDELPEGYNILGEPSIHVSKPLPTFEFGVDEETGETYRNPDSVIVDFKVYER